MSLNFCPPFIVMSDREILFTSHIVAIEADENLTDTIWVFTNGGHAYDLAKEEAAHFLSQFPRWYFDDCPALERIILKWS